MQKTSGKIPYLTIFLIAANAAVFFIMDFTIGTNAPQIFKYGGVYYDSIMRDGEWWRLIASCFLHYDFTHLAFNMFSLFAVGSALETEYGRLTFALTYAISGVAGGAVSMLVYHNAGNDFLSAGASGAICGLVGFYAVKMLFGRVKRSAGDVLRPLIAAAIIVFSGMGDDSIDQLAHVFGLAAGIIIGIISGVF